MEEVVPCIGKHIFGTEIVGRNGVYFTKRLMLDYKLNPNYGIYKWATRMTQLNKLIPYMPNNALNKKGLVKKLFNEMYHQEILDGALPRMYQSQLYHMEWNIYEEPYAKTVHKLELIELLVKAVALEGESMLELEQKFNDRGKARSKREIVLKK